MIHDHDAHLQESRIDLYNEKLVHGRPLEIWEQWVIWLKLSPFWGFGLQKKTKNDQLGMSSTHFLFQKPWSWSIRRQERRRNSSVPAHMAHMARVQNSFSPWEAAPGSGVFIGGHGRSKPGKTRYPLVNIQKAIENGNL
jgi:hypothetical protein